MLYLKEIGKLLCQTKSTYKMTSVFKGTGNIRFMIVFISLKIQRTTGADMAGEFTLRTSTLQKQVICLTTIQPKLTIRFSQYLALYCTLQYLLLANLLRSIF